MLSAPFRIGKKASEHASPLGLTLILGDDGQLSKFRDGKSSSFTSITDMSHLTDKKMRYTQSIGCDSYLWCGPHPSPPPEYQGRGKNAGEP